MCVKHHVNLVTNLDTDSAELRHSQSVGATQAVLETSSHLEQKMWKYCETYSRNIEIVYKSDNDQDILTRIYYPLPPTVRTNVMFLTIIQSFHILLYILICGVCPDAS